MTPDDLGGGFAHLPPDKRALLARRIKVIKMYIRDRTRQNAERGAAELGLSIVHFKKLVSVWEAHGRADELPGAEWRKTKTPATTSEQLRVIREAIDRVPDGNVEDVLREAVRIAAEEMVAMPSPNSVRARIKHLRGGGASASLFGGDCDLVVDHCGIDIPVENPAGGATMPIAAIVLDVRRRKVLGLSLSLEGPNAATTAIAVTQALSNFRALTGGVTHAVAIRLAMDSYPGPEWEDLTSRLAGSGVERIGEYRDKPRRDVAVGYLGPKPNGIALKSRMVERTPSERSPRIRSGQTPMTIREAQDFVTAILMGS